MEDIDKILKPTEEQKNALLETQSRIFEAHKLEPIEGEDVIEDIIRVGAGDHSAFVI